MDYSQPHFYRFNSDSIQLVKFVIQETKSLKINKVLDIFSGCGVLGLEYAQMKNTVELVDFVELQKEFMVHLQQNITFFFPQNKGDVFMHSVFDYELNKEYDLLLANPPYFDINEGRKAQDLNRRVARSFCFGSKDQFLEKLLSFKDSIDLIYFVFRGDINKPSFKKCLEVAPNTFIYQLT